MHTLNTYPECDANTSKQAVQFSTLFNFNYHGFADNLNKFAGVVTTSKLDIRNPISPKKNRKINIPCSIKRQINYLRHNFLMLFLLFTLFLNILIMLKNKLLLKSKRQAVFLGF